MESNQTVSTLLVPAAGLGTRMLPGTKVLPKELLPIVDRPIVQYGVEEAVRAGIRQVVLITNPENKLTASHSALIPYWKQLSPKKISPNYWLLYVL